MNAELLAARLRVRHLNCFAAVAREQHLGRAAEQLRLSQPAVSKTLAELEALAGCRLFERGRHGARLTPAGAAFLPHALTVLDAWLLASGVFAGEQAPSEQTVNVGALPSVAPDLLPIAIAAMRVRRPATRVVLRTAANAPLLDLLRGGAIDFAVGRLADPQQMIGLSFEFLYIEPLVLAVRPGHPLLKRRPLRLAQVLDYPLVVFSRGTLPRHSTESYLGAQGLRLPHNCVESLSISVGRLLTRSSDSVWFTPAGAVRTDLEQGHLARLPHAMPGTEEPVGLLTRSEGQRSSIAGEFASMLRDAARQRGAHARPVDDAAVHPRGRKRAIR